MVKVGAALLLAAGMTGLLAGSARAQGGSPLADAQRLFYISRFEDAATAAQELLKAEPGNLAAWELRTSALHFHLRKMIGDGKDKKAAFAACAECPRVLAIFFDDVNAGRAAARVRLEPNPADEEAQFFLGKIDLSYLWLQLSTLDRKTGWSEYWEAKRLLEAILAKNPSHVRARVARAWMDYIVGSRVPWGTRWVMGGGSKSRGLKMVREAADAASDYFTKVEAQFALWEMLAREGRREQALVVAKELLAKFPENRDLTRFVENSGKTPPS